MRFLAAFLGITFLPLRIFVHNVLAGLVIFLTVAGIVIVGLPIIALVKAYNARGLDGLLGAAALITLFWLPVAPCILVITGIFLLCQIVADTLITAWNGLKQGLLRGMEGFWREFDAQRSFGLQVVLWLFADNSNAINDVDFDGFQRIPGELVDVPVARENLEVPDLQGNVPNKQSTLLTDIELKQIEELIEGYRKSREPLSPEVKEQVENLKTLLGQYNDLFSKLKDVRVALEKNEQHKINDDLVAFNEVKTPILLIKQYQKGEEWYNVPACSYVTDKDSLLTWLKNSPKHPANNDFLKNPPLYNGMKTQYIWYELTANNCFSQELNEAAVEMRFLAKALTDKLSEIQRMSLGSGTSSQTFFAVAPAVPDQSDLYSCSLQCR